MENEILQAIDGLELVIRTGFIVVAIMIVIFS